MPDTTDFNRASEPTKTREAVYDATSLGLFLWGVTGIHVTRSIYKKRGENEDDAFLKSYLTVIGVGALVNTFVHLGHVNWTCDEVLKGLIAGALISGGSAAGSDVVAYMASK